MKPCESMLPVQAGLLRPEPGLLLLSPGKDANSSRHIPNPSPPVIFSGWGGGGGKQFQNYSSYHDVAKN